MNTTRAHRRAPRPGTPGIPHPPGTPGRTGAARRTARRVLLAGLVILGAALAGGCLSTGGGSEVAAARAEAEARAAAGDYAGAARALEGAVNGTTGELREALLLEAAAQWMYAGEPGRAVALANQRQAPLPDPDDPVARLVAGSQALSARRPAQARDWLDAIPRPYPQALAPLILQQRALACFALGDPGSAVTALAERELWLSDVAAVRGNHQLMWRQLLASDAGTLRRALAQGGTDRVVEGWLTLATIGQRMTASPGRGRDALADWRRRHPGHPANANVVPVLLSQYRADTTVPGQVALLLPLSGPLARSAQAVRDGFVSAVLEADEAAAAMQVEVYDTAGTSAAEAYAQAVADGADFVVGPLLKREVAAVAALRERVPTLALNDPGEPGLPPGSDFYRFALSPEEEARQATARAVADGYRDLIALVPTNAWGERMLGSIRSVLATAPGAVAAGDAATADTAGDGQALAGAPAESAADATDDAEAALADDAGATAAEDGAAAGAAALPAAGEAALIDYSWYAPSAVDFSAPIRRALRLDQSDARHEDLRRILGTRLEHEPRRRADVDALVVAARADEARLIRPQLRFHYAADLPVYMTSAALDPAPADNGELEGVYFADIPWLESAVNAQDPRWQALREHAADGVSRARLFAFGADAFALLPELWSGVVGNEVLLDGLTGRLRAEPDGRIARELAILQLRGDRLVRVDLPPEAQPPPPPGR